MSTDQHPLEKDRDELLELASREAGVADAIRLQAAVAQVATLREKVALAYEPQGFYGIGFAQPR